MTEYGGTPGHQPWHPQDPLYGDQDWGTHHQPGNDPHHQQQTSPQQYPYDAAPHDPYQQQGYGGDQYGGQGYATGQTPQEGQQGQQYGTGHWDTGTGQQASMPYYGAQPPHPDPYGAQGADLYSTPEAYPPPQPPGQRRAEPEPAADDWQAQVPEEERHPFFDGPADEDDDRRPDRDAPDGRDDEDEGTGDGAAPGRRGRGRGRGGRSAGSKKRKSRNGVACLFVAAVLVGGLGGVGYFGYQFYQGQFGAAPDYSGTGSGQPVQIEVPAGAGGAQIGEILLKAGVVKSIEAFTTAQDKHPKGRFIQPGFYALKKEMSGAAAVEAMLSAESRNVLIIPEGKRNAGIYKMIDKKLEIDEGTTAKVAKEKAGELGLPDWAKGHPDVKDPLEGFLYPADYPAPKGGKPEDVLKKMVARANSEYAKYDMEAKAAALKLKGPWELLTVASLVQAEGKTEDDFRKMSEVVYNRLKPTNTETNQLLQFDSAFNYLMGQSEIKISEAEINNNKDPYNTYTRKGLTPGPIGNPGREALEAAVNPTSEGWMYFVATDGAHKTEFARTHDDFLKLKAKLNENLDN
ncbi:endolytic transglycosylase MltG [Streptomyces sp. CC228A]|uniref:endolytic transglycosylase MltG n=1 Tax=Streptomyces sp. CC228A TaxID=2898186 RepID=UPI001F3AE6F8|nr:endolytic transglycosylase MltG [Streptomyces sp. CC228A]